MKKLLTIIIVSILMMGYTTQAQDSTSIFSADKFKAELTLASRNVYRGVSYGESPSIMMKGAWSMCKYTELGVYGNMTMNGVKEGYGNQINWYLTINPFVNSKSELKNISITSDDFYYFNANDADNGSFFAWSPEKTNHFMEARAKYDGKLDLTVAYTYLANKNAKVDGIYFEGGYDISKTLYISAGYLTAQNDLMFQNKGGWTNVGATLTTKLHIGDYSPILKTSVIASPNYENTYDSPGVGRNPISLVAALTF